MTDLERHVDELMPQVRDDLAALVAVPSVGLPGAPREPLADAAQLTARVLAAAGWGEVALVDVPGAPPAVVGRARGSSGGGPSVLLYAHYDVMPAGPEDAWRSPPWRATERDGRLYGRGTADDKCGIAMHAGTLRAFAGRPPVDLTVLVEGAEEAADGSLERLLRADPERFRADCIVLADCGNRRTGEPTLTTALRGLASVDVVVSTLAAPIHSGLFGGPVPDAAIALARMLATLHDDHGDVVVPGLLHESWSGALVDRAELSAAAGLLAGVELLGDGALDAQLFARPAVNAIGLDLPPVDGAANTLVPTARARISARLAPGDDPDRAALRLCEYLRRVAPWGANVELAVHQTARGVRLEPGSAVEQQALAAMSRAYGREAQVAGCGGGLPLLPALVDVFPEIQPVLWGAYDDRSQVHAADESVDLHDLRSALLAQVLLIDALAAG